MIWESNPVIFRVISLLKPTTTASVISITTTDNATPATAIDAPAECFSPDDPARRKRRATQKTAFIIDLLTNSYVVNLEFPYVFLYYKSNKINAITCNSGQIDLNLNPDQQFRLIIYVKYTCLFVKLYIPLCHSTFTTRHNIIQS